MHANNMWTWSDQARRPDLTLIQSVNPSAQFGEGLGPATRRVLARLFAVLDANGSGALEHEVGRPCL